MCFPLKADVVFVACAIFIQGLNVQGNMSYKGAIVGRGDTGIFWGNHRSCMAVVIGGYFWRESIAARDNCQGMG